MRDTMRPPPPEKILGFFLCSLPDTRSIIQQFRVSNKFVSLRMSYRLELYNRLRVGFALGWSYYSRDRKHNWSELVIYLGLISITIKGYEKN